jgi:hypothetical protein
VPVPEQTHYDGWTNKTAQMDANNKFQWLGDENVLEKAAADIVIHTRRSEDINSYILV